MLALAQTIAQISRSARAFRRCGICRMKPIATSRSETTPVGRYSVVAMQRGLLRAIAPVEILVGAERRRVLQLVILDVELISLEASVVAKPRPGQRQQV